MTADNWGTCPKCYEKEKARLEQIADDVDRNYGKVSQRVWLKMSDVLARSEMEIDFDLREDYEIGFRTDGIFLVSYGCKCAKCGFEFEFRSPDPLPAHDVA